MKRLAFLLLTLACGAGQMPAWKTGELSPRERATAKVVQGVGRFSSIWEWESSPWYRTADGLLPPIFIAVAQSDRSACVISGADWALLQAGEHYPCAHWISYRRGR